MNYKGLLQTAQQIIDNNIEIIDGIRQLIELAKELEIHKDIIFIKLRAIESETSYIPNVHLRKRCSEEFLNRINSDIEKFRSEIFELCGEVIKKYNQSQS